MELGYTSRTWPRRSFSGQWWTDHPLNKLEWVEPHSQETECLPGHDKADGYDVGQHPLVSRLLKGAFHQRPPQPRYTQTWDFGMVTAYIRTNGDNKLLSLQDLSHKLAMLMALIRPSRSRHRNMEQSSLFPTSLRIICYAQCWPSKSMNSHQNTEGKPYLIISKCNQAAQTD